MINIDIVYDMLYYLSVELLTHAFLYPTALGYKKRWFCVSRQEWFFPLCLLFPRLICIPPGPSLTSNAR